MYEVKRWNNSKFEVYSEVSEARSMDNILEFN